MGSPVHQPRTVSTRTSAMMNDKAQLIVTQELHETGQRQDAVLMKETHNQTA